jgi:hypothetical protein
MALMLPGTAEADTASEKREIAAYVAAEGQSGRSKALEARALAAAHGRVKRAGPILTFDLTGGPEGIRVEDRTDCKAGMGASDCQQFFLVAALPRRHCYVLVKAHYEGTDYIVIDARTGKGLAFPGPPQFAPRGNLILVLNNSEMAEGRAIEIWKRDAEGGATVEWIHPIGDDAEAIIESDGGIDVAPQSMKLVRWSGERIDLVLHYPAIYDKKPFALKARVERIKGEWKLAVNKPK